MLGEPRKRRARAVGELFAVLADPSQARIVTSSRSRIRSCACAASRRPLDGVSALASSAFDAAPSSGEGRSIVYRLVDDHLRDLVLGAATHVAEGR
jgi:hypothetical protein